MEVLVLRGEAEKSYCRVRVSVDPNEESWVGTQLYKDFMLKPMVGALTVNPPVSAPR